MLTALQQSGKLAPTFALLPAQALVIYYIFRPLYPTSCITITGALASISLLGLACCAA